MTQHAGSTKAGAPYIMKYTDDFGNLFSREVECPAVISHFSGIPTLWILIIKQGKPI
jgi:hypothetical protein